MKIQPKWQIIKNANGQDYILFKRKWLFWQRIVDVGDLEIMRSEMFYRVMRGE